MSTAHLFYVFNVNLEVNFAIVVECIWYFIALVIYIIKVIGIFHIQICVIFDHSIQMDALHETQV